MFKQNPSVNERLWGVQFQQSLSNGETGQSEGEMNNEGEITSLCKPMDAWWKENVSNVYEKVRKDTMVIFCFYRVMP